MLTDSISTNLHQNSLTDTTRNDGNRNSERQLLIDQIINLTCGLSETSIVLLKEIAQQLTNDQYSEQHVIIDKRMQLLQKILKIHNMNLELASSLLDNIRY